MLVVFFFFFKQKTAYEMRISDWSSDVSLPISSNPDSCRGNRCSLNSRQCIRSAAGGSNIDIGPCQRSIAFTASALRNLCDPACANEVVMVQLPLLQADEHGAPCLPARKRVGSGTSSPVRVDPGGRGSPKKTTLNPH